MKKNTAYTTSLVVMVVKMIANTVFKITAYHTDSTGFLCMALRPQRERYLASIVIIK